MILAWAITIAGAGVQAQGVFVVTEPWVRPGAVKHSTEAYMAVMSSAGATLIGVNNRDLRTFQVDLDHTIRMRALVPEECLLIGESGIHCRADVQRLELSGVDAMLVGERLMTQADLAGAVRELLGTL